MKRSILISIIIILLAVLLLLINQKPEVNQKKAESIVDKQGESHVLQEEESFDITDIGATDGADAGYIYEGDRSDTYTFSKIRWEFFELQEQGEVPYSLVRIYLEDFQREGRPIALAGFRLGTHQGACSEMTSSLEVSGVQGEPRSFAMCWWAGAGTEFVVTQEGDLVHVYTRTVEEQAEEFAPLKKVLTINMTKLVL